jgi:hypothetical protein
VRNYDSQLFDAKHAVTLAVCRATRDPSGDALPHLASAIDTLNEKWDELTDCLVRQRQERDEQIRRLIDELAEAKKGKR